MNLIEKTKKKQKKLVARSKRGAARTDKILENDNLSTAIDTYPSTRDYFVPIINLARLSLRPRE